MQLDAFISGLRHDRETRTGPGVYASDKVFALLDKLDALAALPGEPANAGLAGARAIAEERLASVADVKIPGGPMLYASPQPAVTEEEIRGNWHGVFLDGRNEHGSHVLMLPQCSIVLEQDANGDFLKEDAESILRDAEEKGFKVGDAVVVTFTFCRDEDFLSGYYELVGVSASLTALFYGTPEEQARSATEASLAAEGRGA